MKKRLSISLFDQLGLPNKGGKSTRGLETGSTSDRADQLITNNPEEYKNPQADTGCPKNDRLSVKRFLFDLWRGC